MTTPRWRTPTPAERDLVERWVERWNAETGDSAQAPPNLTARKSCDCGTCPTFTVRPLRLTSPLAEDRPLCVEGAAIDPDGDAVAGLIAFTTGQDGVEFEVYPLSNEPVALEDVTIRLDTIGP